MPGTNEPKDAAPKILVEHSDYLHINKGDIAMLDVTVRRIREHLPDARIGVLTEAAPLLRIYVPDAEPVHPWGRSAWQFPKRSPNVLRAPALVGAVVDLRNSLRRGRSSLGGGARRVLRSMTSSASDEAVAVVPTNTQRALSSASLVLGLGGGYLTDVDPIQAKRLLVLLEQATRQGVPCAVVGQGIGPLEDPDLVRSAAETLPHVSFIGLREGTYGPSVLHRLGVSSDRFAVTGDDAIELAYGLRKAELGQGMGICLRIADYSPVSDEVQHVVATVVQSMAAGFDAWLAPVQISEYHAEDRRATMPLVEGFARVYRPLARYSHPREIVARLSSCRVLVTGAYHAAVFALSQGIPVVALSSSPYYDVKFQGLSKMFEGGIELVSLELAGLDERLRGAIRATWDAAPGVRDHLLLQAHNQVVESRDAYMRVLSAVQPHVDDPERR